VSALSHERKWLAACAALAPIFSTCSRRQYAAVVLSPNKRVAGFGYNGAPPGMTHCVDGGCPRGRSEAAPGSPYDDPTGLCFAQHAEAGALLWADPSMRLNGTLIVNGSPCLECARLIVSAGIARLVCVPDSTYAGWPVTEGFLRSAGIDLVVT